MWSAKRTVLSRWEISRLLRPARRFVRLRWISASASASRPADGSSRMSRSAAVRSTARAIATRCHWPPESTTPTELSASSASGPGPNMRVSMVRYPCGRPAMVVPMPAAAAAAWMRGSPASRSPTAMLSAADSS